jgi:hypothetical protein
VSGVLFAIVSGGRPALESRPTAGLLPSLLATGCPVQWVVRADQAAGYETTPGAPINAYPVEWADRYARAHWRHPRYPFTPGGFHGAFTGREWAMRSAEEQGFDAVVQLDDNVRIVGPISASSTSRYPGVDAGEMTLLAAELCLSSTAVTVGFQIASIKPYRYHRLLRTGFPYSVFAERCGAARMPWFGPFEDDIMHSLDYGLNGGPRRTAAVIEPFTYAKEYVRGKDTGMRAHYTGERGLEIARRYPRNVKLRVGNRNSAPKVASGQSIRHYLTNRGFTPVLVTDRERFEAATARAAEIVAEARVLWDATHRAKIEHRAAKAAARADARAAAGSP